MALDMNIDNLDTTEERADLASKGHDALTGHWEEVSPVELGVILADENSWPGATARESAALWAVLSSRQSGKEPARFDSSLSSTRHIGRVSFADGSRRTIRESLSSFDVDTIGCAQINGAPSSSKNQTSAQRRE